MKTLVLTLVVASFALAVRSISIDDLIKDEWEAYKSQHSKTYQNEVEERFRKKIYLENRQTIAKHNKNPDKEFKLEMNKFGDLLPHEFKSIMNGYRMDLMANETEEERIVFLSPENFVAPKSVDWRTKGYVTPIKDQGQCASCWSFSATGALKGQHMRKTGKLVSLSEQNLVDCSRSEGNQGCNGGLMDKAFRYVKKNKGIDTEVSYPYEARDDTCRFTKDHVGADDKGLVDVPSGNEDALMNAVASVGPISVAIDAAHTSFQFYKSGIYIEERCSASVFDHGVLVIGYGTENGKEYWLVKNSWGVRWGDSGYIKMARNKNNQCGVASHASYPVV